MAFIGFLALLGKNQRALHGDARFATMAEVKKVGLIEPKNGLDKTILVGKFKDNYLTYTITTNLFCQVYSSLHLS